MKAVKGASRGTRRIAGTDRLQRQLRGAKADAQGLRYEQRIANYFAGKGWRPKVRFPKYGFEYDIYAMKTDSL